MHLERTDKILTILASLATIVGGVLGIFFLVVKGGDGEAIRPSPQPPIVLRTSGDSSTGKEVPAPKKEEPSVEKEVPAPKKVEPLPQKEAPAPKKVEPLPVVPAAAVYFEDFRKVKEGILPDGWDGDDEIVVVKSGDRPHLAVNGKGIRAVTMMRFPLHGNFFAEWEAANGTTTKMNVIFQGKSGKDVTVRNWHTGGGHDWLFVALGESGQKQVSPVVHTGSAAKYRLERDGDVFRLLVNGTTLHVQRLPGYADFSSIRFELPGAVGTKVYTLKVASL